MIPSISVRSDVKHYAILKYFIYLAFMLLN